MESGEEEGEGVWKVVDERGVRVGGELVVDGRDTCATRADDRRGEVSRAGRDAHGRDKQGHGGCMSSQPRSRKGLGPRDGR